VSTAADSAIERQLRSAGYIADEVLVTALELLLNLQRPLLLEGEAGVGKTDLARALSSVLDTRLIRLQCYEGLDASAALYEWNYQRQLLSIKARERDTGSAAEVEEQIFSDTYLLRRPLLQALSEDKSPVLLVDEIDRADQEFEAYLLELLAEYQVTVPEMGTITARSRPHVILTSNGTRELSDALRRRCLYCWIDYPDAAREMEIVQTKLPDIEQRLLEQLVSYVQLLRKEDLEKNPGIAETIDWAAALIHYEINDLRQDLPQLQKTLICLLKTARDQFQITEEITRSIINRLQSQ